MQKAAANAGMSGGVGGKQTCKRRHAKAAANAGVFGGVVCK
jgi:hypothetical protein